MNGAFIDAQGKLAALQTFQLAQTLLDLVAEIQETLGVFAQQDAGVRKANGAGAADEERLAEGVLEFTDAEADSGLSAVQALGGAGKAAFASDGQKDLQLS